MFYNNTARFERWSQRGKFSEIPRVLIYCWCTEDTHVTFVNAIYWLSCYAHAHGFDIVFTSEMNFTGTKHMKGEINGSQGWYSDQYMWAWVAALPQYLFSGNYDYVFVLGVDTLPNAYNMHFPVWAYDQGHDITIMDTHYWPIGMNENAMLFKPTNFTKKFLEEFFEWRYNFLIQGDNGAWMEMLLIAIGREDKNRPYYGNCAMHLGLGEYSSAWLNDHDLNKLIKQNRLYSDCFFHALDILAGSFGHRKSRHIGFSPTYYAPNPQAIYQYVDLPDKLTPWANCFNYLRWRKNNRPYLNCLFLHWNGPKEGMFNAIRGGQCPDPSFDWHAWKYNPNPNVSYFR